MAVLPSFFMPKFRHKEDEPMFTDGVLGRIYSNPQIRTVPAGAQTTMVDIVATELEKIWEENPYVTLPQLLGYTDESISEF